MMHKQNMLVDLPHLDVAPKEIVKPTFLFTSYQWPSGVLELASYMKSSGLADARVFRIGAVEKPNRDSVYDLGKKHGVDLKDKVDDALLEDISKVGLGYVEKLLKTKPDVVGYQANKGTLDALKSFVNVSRVFSDSLVVVGGPLASTIPERILEFSGADFVFAGESEPSMDKFISYVRNRSDKKILANVPGLCFKHAGKTYVNSFGEGFQSASLNQVQTKLDWNLLDNYGDSKSSSAFMTCGRGCPNLCTFCSRLHGRIMRRKTVDQVLGDVGDMLKAQQNGVIPKTDKIFFGDEEFLNDRNWAHNFFKKWRESDLSKKFKITFQTNPRDLFRKGGFDDELVMAMSGLVSHIQFGTESFSPDVLKRWNKPHRIKSDDPVEGILPSVVAGLDKHKIYHTHFLILSDIDTTCEELVDSVDRTLIMLNKSSHMLLSPNPGMFLYPKTLVHDDLQSRENGFTFMEEFMDGKHGISRHNAKVDKTYGLSFDAVTPNDEIAAYALEKTASEFHRIFLSNTPADNRLEAKLVFGILLENIRMTYVRQNDLDEGKTREKHPNLEKDIDKAESKIV